MKRTSVEKSQNRRLSKWARGDLQLRIIATTFTAAIVALSVGLLSTVVGVAAILEAPPPTVRAALYEVNSMLLWQFFISAFAAAPVAAWVGVVCAFKVCGPLRAFERFFASLDSGPWNRPLNLRPGDGLQDMKTAINTGIDRLKDRIRRQHEVLEDARRVLEQTTTEDSADQIGELLVRIRDEAAEFERRFGDGASDQSTAPVLTGVNAS